MTPELAADIIVSAAGRRGLEQETLSARVHFALFMGWMFRHSDQDVRDVMRRLRELVEACYDDLDVTGLDEVDVSRGLLYIAREHTSMREDHEMLIHRTLRYIRSREILSNRDAPHKQPVTLALEHIGLNYERDKGFHMARYWRKMLRFDEYKKLIHPKSRRPWVAEIYGGDLFKMHRLFLKGHTTHRHADSKGERGVLVYFTLYPGRVYDVGFYTDWMTQERYFCHVEGRKIKRLSKFEVAACLSEDYLSTS